MSKDGEAFKRATDGTGDQEPRGCRFIQGDVKEGGWRYCQAPRRPGSSYCEEHHALTHLPPGSLKPLDVEGFLQTK
jgi:hypothetical protein